MGVHVVMENGRFNKDQYRHFDKAQYKHFNDGKSGYWYGTGMDAKADSGRLPEGKMGRKDYIYGGIV